MFLLGILCSVLSLLQGGDATLVFAGDAMQHDRQIEAARRGDGSFDYSAYFRHVADYVSAADYAVVNLECTLGGKPYKGYPCFSAPEEYAVALKDAGFDLFLHANNHCLDRRDAGLRRTLDQLDMLGVPHIGTYRNAAERAKNYPFVADVKGMKVVVEGVNVATKHQAPRKQGQEGGIIKVETPIYVSKVQVVCPKCGKPTRVAHKFDADGNKSRVCKKCGANL